MSDERPHDPAEGGVTTEVRDRILLIGLDRPAKMNGYTPQMARQLVDAFERLDEDDDRGAGCCSATATTSPPGWTCRNSATP